MLKRRSYICFLNFLKQKNFGFGKVIKIKTKENILKKKF